MTQNPNDWQRNVPPQQPTVAGQPQYPYHQPLPPVFPPGYQGQPNEQGWYPPPQPPQYGPPPRRKGNAGKVIAIGCGGLVLIVVLIVVVAFLLAAGHHPATGG